MVIVMDINAPKEHIQKVKDKAVALGCTPYEIQGTTKLAIGLTGQTTQLKKEEFQILPSVEEVVRISKKYKLVSREVKKENTQIDINGTIIGGEALQVIAGPCSVESRDQIMKIAEQLKELGITMFRAGAYKPRSSPYAFQGLKEEGIKLLDEVKKQFGLNIVTEILDAHTIQGVAEVADLIQIGARNMQNYALLEEIGKVQKPVLLKRGMSATIEDMLMSAEYIAAQNNINIILCERGIRTFETATRNTLDLNAVPVVKKNSHLPIFVDPSHGIGIGEKVPPMALAGVAAGADGLIIEVHSNPAEAISDGYQSLDPETFKKLLMKLKELAPVVGRTINL